MKRLINLTIENFHLCVSDITVKKGKTSTNWEKTDIANKD